MKTVRWFAFLLIVVIVGAGSPGYAQNIHWVSSFAAAKREARNRNCLIMADLYADWCGPCRRMAQTTFTDPTVVDLSKQFVAVKVNIDAKGGRAVSRHYGIRVIPTILMVRADGAIVEKTVGYRAPEAFSQIMRNVLQHWENKKGSAPAPVARTVRVHSSEPTVQARVEKVIALTNQERQRQGLPALTVHPALTAAAQAHAEDMASHNYFNHTDRQGHSPGDRAKAQGYPVDTGENIFFGPQTAAHAVQGWMESEGHRRNILNAGYRAIGVGYASGKNGRPYWVQVFGSETDAAQ